MPDWEENVYLEMGHDGEFRHSPKYTSTASCLYLMSENYQIP